VRRIGREQREESIEEKRRETKSFCHSRLSGGTGEKKCLRGRGGKRDKGVSQVQKTIKEKERSHAICIFGGKQRKCHARRGGEDVVGGETLRSGHNVKNGSTR